MPKLVIPATRGAFTTRDSRSSGRQRIEEGCATTAACMMTVEARNDGSACSCLHQGEEFPGMLVALRAAGSLTHADAAEPLAHDAG
jgi:hypothetical protein